MRAILQNLSRSTRASLLVIFILQTIAFLYFLITIPFHYDEAWTYIYFTGKGFLRTITFYPIPNNHILYNLVAGVFDLLPFPPEITTRLPSYFSSLVATWYFFRITSLYFTEFTALITTAIFAAAFPVVLYSIEARGYSFVLCFTVLLLYAAVQLIREPDDRRHRYLYLFSLVAGMYSMPSFIYSAIVISGALFLHYMIKKWPVKTLFLDHLKAGLIVVLLYAPIVYFNGIDKLKNPVGFRRVTTAQLTASLGSLLSSILHFLSGMDSLPLLALVLLIPAGLWFIRLGKENSRFLVLVCMIMLVSPVFILYLNPVLPYPRTWLYLIVPLALLVGCLIAILTHYWRGLRSPNPLTTALILLISFAGYLNFRSRHRQQYAIDYGIRSMFQQLSPNFGRIRSIGYTGAGLEFYVAEDLQFQCMKRHNSPRMDNSAAITNTEDVLVLAAGAPRPSEQYEAIATDSINYTLYLRRL